MKSISNSVFFQCLTYLIILMVLIVITRSSRKLNAWLIDHLSGNCLVIAVKPLFAYLKKLFFINLKNICLFFAALLILFYLRFSYLRQFVENMGLINISGVLAIMAIIANYASIEEKRNQMKNLETAQAQKISSWVLGVVEDSQADTFGNTLANSINISNQSNMPVYDLWCFFGIKQICR